MNDGKPNTAGFNDPILHKKMGHRWGFCTKAASHTYKKLSQTYKKVSLIVQSVESIEAYRSI